MQKTRILLVAALLLLCSLVPLRAQETLTVCDGTSTSHFVPAYIYYWDDFTRSQFVIPADSLAAMNGGTISALTFYTTSQDVPYTSVSTCDVYLKEVSGTTLSSYADKSSATVVYSGTVSIVAAGSGGAMTLTFSTPYAYNGGNLLIGIENTTDAGYKDIFFYGKDVTGASGAGYDAGSLSNVNFAQRDFIPKTTFTYTAGSSTPEWNFGDTMAYCGTDATFISGIGRNSVDTITWGIKYPASLMAGRQYLDKVRLYYNDNAPGNYTLTVYQGGDEAPQTQIYTHTYALTGEDGWRDLEIFSTVHLDPTKSLWIVMKALGYAASNTNPVNDDNAQLYLGNSGWIPLRQVGYDRAWMLYAVTSATQPALPALGVNIVGPASESVDTWITFSVFRAIEGVTYSWTLTGATPATATGTTARAMWSAAGTYDVICTATGGSQTASDTLQVTIYDCGGALALPFTCGFEESDILDCWTFVDADGDGHGWEEADIRHGGDAAYASASYILGVGSLIPDNWMITPKLHIPAQGATLGWFAMASYQDDHEEVYSVQVSTTTTATSAFTTTLFSDTLDHGLEPWDSLSVSLNQFAGQDIYIAFRHYNCTNQYRLLIDDISVTANGSQGIANADAVRVKVYPNPATSVVTVSMGDDVSTVELVDQQGRVVYKAAAGGDHRVDVGNMARGIYFVRVSNIRGTAVSKLLVL